MGRRLYRGSRGALKESAPLAAQASVGSSGPKACGEGPCLVSPLHGGFLRRSGPAGGRATVQRSCNISRSQKALSEAVEVGGRRGEGRCPCAAKRLWWSGCWGNSARRVRSAAAGQAGARVLRRAPPLAALAAAARGGGGPRALWAPRELLPYSPGCVKDLGHGARVEHLSRRLYELHLCTW